MEFMYSNRIFLSLPDNLIEQSSAIIASLKVLNITAKLFIYDNKIDKKQ